MKCNKRIILTLSMFLSLLLCACTSSQNKKDAIRVDEESLKKEVTTTEEPTEIIEEEKSGENQENGIWLISKEIRYIPNNPEHKSVWEYHYQDGNHLIEKVQIEKMFSADVDWKIGYEYEGDRLLREVEYNQGHPYGTNTYEYDEAGNISKTISSSPMGYMESTYIYNIDGSLKQIVTYGGQAGFELTTTDEFDADGKRIDTIEHLSDTIRTYSYEYDENGNLIKEISYSNGKEGYVIEYEYTYYLKE